MLLILFFQIIVNSYYRIRTDLNVYLFFVTSIFQLLGCTFSIAKVVSVGVDNGEKC